MPDEEEEFTAAEASVVNVDPVEQKKLAKKDERRLRKLKRKLATTDLAEAKPQQAKKKKTEENGDDSEEEEEDDDEKSRSKKYAPTSEKNGVKSPEKKFDVSQNGKNKIKKEKKSPGKATLVVTNGKGAKKVQSPVAKGFKKMKKNK
jgi:hypothetical protein